MLLLIPMGIYWYRGAHRGETGRHVSPVRCRRDFWRFFYTRGVLLLELLIAKCAANGSRAIELLLSRLNCIMLLLRLHDVTILREVAFRIIIHELESKNKWRKLAASKTSGGDNIAVHNASEKTKIFAKSCHSGDAILPGTTAQNSSSTSSTPHYVPNVQDTSTFVQ